MTLQTSGPEAREEYVAYKQGQRPTLYEPAEAEALAFSLLGAAQKARAYRMECGASERREGGRESGSEERIV